MTTLIVVHNMGKLKEHLLREEENQMEQDELDSMWHQKQLEEEQQQGELSDLLNLARERNLFKHQAMLDAIAYSKLLRVPKIHK